MSSDMGNCGMCEYKSPEEVDTIIERIKEHRCIVCEQEPDLLMDYRGVLYCVECLKDAQPEAYEHLHNYVAEHEPRERSMSPLGASTFAFAGEIVRSQASQYKQRLVDDLDRISQLAEAQSNHNDGWAAKRAQEKGEHKSKIICLCGSTRFTAEMLVLQWELTKQGCIVLSWCALPDSYFKGQDKTHIGDQEGVKALVDEVHKRKIDLADEVLVLNIGGYIGESTRSEIDYARAHGKPVRYLENIDAALQEQKKEKAND